MLGISNYTEPGDPRVTSWEKVTRKVVDPITFSCSVSVGPVPHIEDTYCERLHHYHSQPRLVVHRNPDLISNYDDDFDPDFFAKKAAGLNASKKSEGSNSAFDWDPFFDATTTPTSSNRKATPTKSSLKRTKKTKTSNSKKQTASLGQFFGQQSASQLEDMDNHSISSKSMNSRSVADRSRSERSKSEEKLKRKKAQRSGGSIDESFGSSLNDISGHLTSSHGRDNMMMSIHEGSITDFSNAGESLISGLEFGEPAAPRATKTSSASGGLGNFLETVGPLSGPPIQQPDLDMRSIVSGSTIESRSKSERSKKEAKLRMKRVSSSVPEDRPLTPPNTNGTKASDDDENSIGLDEVKEEREKQLIVKNFRIKDGHDVMEIPRLTESMYDDLFWTSDELAEFRYEAFLEEAGLDKDEYM